MAGAIFPVVEYDLPTDVVWASGALRQTWSRRIAVDLQQVTSLRVVGDGRVEITLLGYFDAIVLVADYQDFVSDWMRARGL